MDPFTAIGIGATIFSGVTGAIGGNERARANQKAADKRAKQEKEMAEWSWKETRNRERYAQHEVDIARINEANVRNFSDVMKWEEYNRNLYIRDYDYKSKVEAYNASELAYAQKLDYNAMASRLAMEENATWIDEQLQQAAFQEEELAMNSQKMYDDIALDLARGRDTFDLVRASTNLQHRTKSAEFAGKALEGMIKTLEAKGKARAKGQAGRTGRKSVQAIGAIADFQQSMLNDMATKSEQAFANQQEQNYAQYQQVRAKTRIEKAFVDQQYEFGKRKIQSSRDSAFKAYKSNQLRIEFDKYGADMAADSQRQAPPPAYDELPPIPAPYFTPQTHIPDAYKTKKKPPGPVGAPNLMAGAGMTFASNIIGSVASAANAYSASQAKPKPGYTGGGGGSNQWSGSMPWQDAPSGWQSPSYIPV